MMAVGWHPLLTQEAQGLIHSQMNNTHAPGYLEPCAEENDHKMWDLLFALYVIDAIYH